MVTVDIGCPRCGSPMLTRTNRESGDAFLGCSRFPDCRATRPIVPSGNAAAARGRLNRPKLSLGGRPRNLPDYVELIVARAIGRDLTPVQGFLVQALAIVLVAGAFWALLASGLFVRIVEPIAQWYANQVFPAPSASPLP
jgi:hypothetical protein